MTHMSDGFFLNFDLKEIFILAEVRDIFQKILVFTLTPQNLGMFVQGTADRSYSRPQVFLKIFQVPTSAFIDVNVFFTFFISLCLRQSLKTCITIFDNIIFKNLLKKGLNFMT